MSSLKYQNPVTVDAVLDSLNLGGSPEVRREIVALGDASATVAVVGTALKTDGSAVTQPVSIAAALPAGANVIGRVINDAGSAVIGHVIADTGSTTAVTGNVTAVQPTGSNLHVAVDSAPSTPVTNVGTFATQATLAAETTKVIGVVRNVGNAGSTLDSTVGAASAPANALMTSAIYNATVPVLSTGQAVGIECDSTGSVYSNNEGRKATYRMSVSRFAPIADATKPVFSIQGSGTKTVRVTRIHITAAGTTGTTTPFHGSVILQKFSVLSGGVTGTTPAASLNDSANAAQTAICLQYSTLPTTATVIGGVAASEIYQIITPTISLNGVVAIDWSFGNSIGQSLVLRGTGEYYGINVTTIGGSAPVMSIWIEWTEE